MKGALLELKAKGNFHITYDWLKTKQDSYKALSPSTDIASYFDSEYGSTVFENQFFIDLCNQYGLKLENWTSGTCCDRQDIYIFKKHQ